MSEKKSVAKSIRLTPELYDFINKYDGNGFNEKFANIISFCFHAEKDIRTKVQREKKVFAELDKQITKKRALLTALQRLEWQIDHATAIAQELPIDEVPEKEKNVDGQEQFF